MMKHLLIFLFSSGVVFGASVVFNGDFVKTFRDDLKLGETARIITGTADPSSSATDGEPGSIYIRNNGGVGSVFFKTDTGSSTNWSAVSDSATVTEIDANVNDLITLSGVAENTTNLGTFTGTTFTDATGTIKSVLQEAETAIESNDTDIAALQSGRATTELDNLGTTAINANLLPDTAGNYNLGSSSAEWNNIFADFTEFKSFRLVDNSDNIALSVSSGTNTFTAADGYGLGLATANATSTQGQTFTTGNASGGNSGGFTFTTGTATGTRGSFNADANIINLDFDTSMTLNAATVTTSGSRVDFVSLLTSGDLYVGGATGAFFDVSQDWMGLLDEWALRFYDNDTNYTGFKAPVNLTGDVTFTLPNGDGSAGQVLKTDGSATLSWDYDRNGSNLETDPFFQNGIGSWTEYDNADMDAISTDNITVTASATSTQIAADPFDGNVQIAVGGSSASGDGLARTYTVGNDFQDAGCAYISFKYGTSTGFSTGDFILAARRVTATAADLNVQGLDGSAQLVGLAANATNRGTARVCYASDIASFRIGFEVASATTNIDLFISDVTVTTDAYVDSPIIENLTFDESSLKMWNTTTDAEIAHAYTLDAIGYRNGEWLHVTGTATASASSSVLQPLALHFTNYTISTDHQTLSVVGSGEHTADYGLVLRYNSTTSDIVFRDTSSGIVYAGDFDNTEVIGFEFKVKIADWANQSAVLSTNEMMNQTSSAGAKLITANQTVSAAATDEIVFNSERFDTHAEFSTSNGRMTAHKPGRYKVNWAVEIQAGATAPTDVEAFLQVNGTGDDLGRYYSDTWSNNENRTISGYATVDLDKDDYVSLWVNPTGQAVDVVFDANNDNSSVYTSIEPDFSVYGVYGKHEIKYAESAAINLSTGGTSGDYLQTSVSVTLTPGVWEVRCTAELVGATSGVSQINFNLYEADGDGTGSAPTALGTSSNYSVDYNVAGLLLEDSDADIWERHTTVAYADLTVTTTDTFYCVPRYNYTSATGSSTINIRAKRLQ